MATKEEVEAANRKIEARRKAHEDRIYGTLHYNEDIDRYVCDEEIVEAGDRLRIIVRDHEGASRAYVPVDVVHDSTSSHSHGWHLTSVTPPDDLEVHRLDDDDRPQELVSLGRPMWHTTGLEALPLEGVRAQTMYQSYMGVHNDEQFEPQKSEWEEWADRHPEKVVRRKRRDRGLEL